MRKIIIVSIAFVFALSSVFAQEESKKGEKKDFSEMMPQAGSFALGLDMAQFTKSILASFMRPGEVEKQNTVKAFQGDIFGKFFLSNQGAIRVRLGILMDNSTERFFVRDDEAFLSDPINNNDPILQKKTVDVRKGRYTDFEIGIGYEYRKISLWRMQGYFGGEVFGGPTFDRTYYEYGNQITKENEYPSIYTHAPGALWGSRPLDSKSNGFTVGAALFIGADLFLCKNLSIGAEFDLAGRYIYEGELAAKTETRKLNQPYKAEEKIKPAGSSFRIKPNGRLNLMIYF